MYFFPPQITIAAKCFTTYFISTLLILNALSIILRSRGGKGGGRPTQTFCQANKKSNFIFI